MSFNQFVRELFGKRVEGEIITTIFIALISGFGTLALLYFLNIRYIEGFGLKYGFWIFFTILSYSLIMGAMRQVGAYKEFPCMSGMMIGMTLGMISSFLAGMYVGATNGMFYGGFFGVGVGMIFGILNGKTCGVMGVMEGAMAAFMGGLMGAMSAVMMINDHIKSAAVIMFLIGGGIVFGLNYMIYKETKTSEREIKRGYFGIIMGMIVLSALTIWMIGFGPRGGIFS